MNTLPKKKYSLQDKVLLITGAASGIGKALSLAAAREGARLALLDRDERGLHSVCAEIQGAGGRAEPFPCDLADSAAVQATAGRIEQRLGGVDVLVNCAARGVEGLVQDVPLEDFKACHDVNFYGPLALIKALLPGMKRSGGGQIVNLSTTMGRRAFPGKVSYCVTKFALNALTEGLRLELKPFGINVMMVSPGPTESGLYQSTVRHGNLEIGFDKTVKRQDPSRIAQKILRGIERRSRTVIQWTPGELLVRVNGLFPRFVDYALSKIIPVPGPETRPLR